MPAKQQTEGKTYKVSYSGSHRGGTAGSGANMSGKGTPGKTLEPHMILRHNLNFNAQEGTCHYSPILVLLYFSLT
jgi:hypothetical protein